MGNVEINEDLADAKTSSEYQDSNEPNSLQIVQHDLHAISVIITITTHGQNLKI